MKLDYEVNTKLMKKLGISMDKKPEIKAMYQERERLRKELEVCTIEEDAKQLFKAFTQNEYSLQRIWGFEGDWRYHKGYKLNWCTCPVLDNDDYNEHIHYTLDCPLHKDLLNIDWGLDK